jgi:hypothetical protein
MTLATAWSGVAETPQHKELEESLGGSFVMIEGSMGECEQQEGAWSELGVNSSEADLDPSFGRPDFMDGSYMVPSKTTAEASPVERRNSNGWVEDGLHRLGNLAGKLGL